MTHDKDKKESSKTDPEMTQWVESVDRDIKRVIITLFQIFKKPDENLIVLGKDR